MPAEDLMRRFRQWVTGEDTVSFTDEEWAWIREEGHRYLRLVDLAPPAQEGDGDG